MKARPTALKVYQLKVTLGGFDLPIWQRLPVSGGAYDLREELSAIFDAKQSKDSATRAISSWIDKVKRSGLKCFDSFLITLDNWLDEITNYFLDRQTSGFQEGFNNKIKVLKRRCYGITNISHLFQRIWLDLEGFKLFRS